MPDEQTQPTPRPRTTRRTGRRPRFALPADHHDEQDSDRTTERIEAFLDGPARARRTRRRHVRADAGLRPRRIVPMDPRTDWERALRHEDARVARYGRPASVIVLDVRLAPGSMDDRHVARVGTVIRAQARETDRVARVAPTRFQLLLPETDEREAAALADRITRACRDVVPSGEGAGGIRAAVASPPGGGSLTEALRVARIRLDG